MPVTFKIPGQLVIRLVLEGLERDREKLEAMGSGNERAADLHALAGEGRVSCKLHVPASGLLDEDDFVLEFVVKEDYYARMRKCKGCDKAIDASSDPCVRAYERPPGEYYLYCLSCKPPEDAALVERVNQE